MVGSKDDEGKMRGKGRKNDKRRHPPTPPLEDFNDLDYLEQKSSSGDERTPAPTPQSPSFVYTDDSMGFSAVERAYIWAIERAGLDCSNDSREKEEFKDEEEDDEAGYDGVDEGGNDDKVDSGGGDGKVGNGKGGSGKVDSGDDGDDGSGGDVGSSSVGGRSPPA
jgi:hypothetical protein